jgi:hypothetical protein
MAKLSDRPEQKLGVEILKARVGEVKTASAAVETAAAALIAGDTTGQFADDAALVTAFNALRESYTAITIPGLGDVTDLFVVE